MRTRLCAVSGAVMLAVIFAGIMSLATPEPTASVRIGSVVQQAALSPDGEYLAVACDDGMVRLFEVGTWALAWEATLHDTGAVSAVAFLPDGSEVVAGLSGEADIVFLGAPTGRELRRLSLYGAPQGEGYYDEDMFVYVTSMALSSNGKLLAAGCWASGHVKLVDISTGLDTIVIRHGYQNPLGVLAFSPDGTLLASPGSSRVVVISTAAGEEIASLSRPGLRDSGVASFSPDGSLLALAGGTSGGSSSGSTNVLIYETDEWTLQRLPWRNDALSGTVVFSPDGEFLVAGGKNLAVWSTGEFQLLSTHAIPTYRRTGVAWMGFTPDMEFLLIAGGGRGFIEVWRFSELCGD